METKKIKKIEDKIKFQELLFNMSYDHLGTVNGNILELIKFLELKTPQQIREFKYRYFELPFVSPEDFECEITRKFWDFDDLPEEVKEQVNKDNAFNIVPLEFTIYDIDGNETATFRTIECYTNYDVLPEDAWYRFYTGLEHV